MPYATQIHPLHHTTCDYPLSFPPGTSVRVVLTRDGIFMPLLDWFRAPRNRNKSRSWQRSASRAVGLFYDFFQQSHQAYVDSLIGKRILSDFAEALLCGTIGLDGDDPRELFWPKVEFTTADIYIDHLTQFSDFCVEQYGSKPLNPWTTSNWAERMAAFRAWDIKNRNSLLKHVGDRRAAWSKTAHRREVNVGTTVKADLSRPPYFPPERFEDLVTRGFLVRGRESHAVPYMRYHIRDMLIALLQGGGGLRESEPFHLFLDDVHEDSRRPGSALVRVHHPEEGKYRYPDPLTRRWITVTRAEYLKRTGYVARNRAGQRRLFAGWKSPLLVKEKSGDLYMPVHWFPSWCGELFWQLYRIYVFHVRPITDCPFLLVTHHGKHAGEPYTIHQYNKKLASAVSRIGLMFHKDAGTTSHGLRHMYGQLLTSAGVGEAEVQKCLHHKSIKSTAVYTRPEADKINQLLRSKAAGLCQFVLPNLRSA